jgi:RNA polymerase sigma-70 factor (ECF subfamily)
VKFFIGNQEERLARRLQGGDSDALRDYYTLYADVLTGVCARYVKKDEDLKDVLQDAFLNIISHIKDFKYQGDGSLRAWSTKIVINEALRFLKQRHLHDFELLDQDVTDEQEEEDPTIHDIPPEVFQQMIRELPTGYRTVFNLYVFENKSHQEIAELLGIKKDTSCSQFSRAKNLLAKKIKEFNNSKNRSR